MLMTIKRATWNNGPDLAFDINNKANAAIEKYGREAVINAALGTLLDDKGKIIALPSVYDRLDEMDRSHIASYAPIEGEKDYRKIVIDTLFGPYRPEGYISAIATPGGTGAIRSAIFSYLDEGDPLICHDYYWAPYRKICEEFGRDFKTFEFFTDDFAFNIDAYKEAIDEGLRGSDRIASLINSPGNNPTGYSLSDEEWDEVITFLKEKAEDKDKKITLIVDVAYLEFAGDGDQQRKFFEKFSNLPRNLFVVVTFSMSKSHTAYGLRSGAAVGISSRLEIIEEFEASLAHSARCNWSNGTHAAQNILIELEKAENKKIYEKELVDLRAMLKKRADVFVEAAKENKLTMIPYFGGFFTFIPTDRAFDIVKDLEKENIFTIPSAKGIRIAICGVGEEKIPKLVQRLAFYTNKK